MLRVPSRNYSTFTYPMRRSSPKTALRSPTKPPTIQDTPPMLRYQDNLPRLPVPRLGSTIGKYVESVEPHLSPEAFSQTSAVSEAFFWSPEAAELQRRLRARALHPDTKNWLADWWNDTAYMGYRDPVIVYVSYYYVHVDDKRGLDQVSRAATLVKGTQIFRDLVESQRLEPDKNGKVPVCMSSFKWMFHSSRLPAKPSDVAKKFDYRTHNHVVFVRKNKFFKVSLTHANGIELSVAELACQIERVIRMAGSEKSIPIGALTSENRDVWTEVRKSLIHASPINAKSLEEIDSAMIVVALDDTKPVTRNDLAWASWVGDGRNRFYDKQQIIVFENGKSAFLGEHSSMDGTATLRMNEFVVSGLGINPRDFDASRSEETGKGLPEPTELTFVVNNTIKQFVVQAENSFDDLIGKHDLHVLHYDKYGKKDIRKLGFTPDSWAQMVKQLAFHKMFGRPGVCYESAATRKFQLGRTEVIRSASNESKAWAEAMLDPSRTDEEKARLFREATERHVMYTKWAVNGLGVDRHLFGLKKMLMPHEKVPDIFKDEAFSKTNHWEMSTSQLSSQFLDGWGFGEVVPDGFGLAYSIGDDYIRWTVTSLKRGSAEFARCLEEAATETKRVIEKVHKPVLKPSQSKL